jgi:hypothetical protein
MPGLHRGSLTEKAKKSLFFNDDGRCPGPPEEKEAQTSFHIRYMCQILMKIGRSSPPLRGSYR